MNKFVFITGGTSGFGEACAHIFAQNGWNIILTGRRTDRLEKVSKELISKYTIKVETLCFDVRELNEVNRAIDSLSENVKSSIEKVTKAKEDKCKEIENFVENI